MDDGASLNLEDLISGKHPFVSHCLSDAEKNDRMRWAEKLHRDIQLAASSPIARGTFTIEGLKEELIRDLIFASGGLIGEKCSKEIFRTLVKSLDAKSI